MTALTADILQAAAILAAGGIVAFPTETVYGLGADAENPEAIAKIYAAKERPSNHPVIVHLALGADIHYWAQDIPPQAEQLISAFWPGPLTLILQRAEHIPDAVSGGQASIGLRCPAHPVAQTLLQHFKGGKGGVAAPSANKFGHVSPTTAQHVRDEFGIGEHSPVDFILDGGPSEVGIESTILDLSRMATQGPVLLRPGHISAASIAKVIDMWPHPPDAEAPRVSGALDSHYAPHTPVVLVAAGALTVTLSHLELAQKKVALMHLSSGAFPGLVAQCALPSSPDGYAHHLYAALRAMDLVNADIILVEAPPVEEAWLGVNDRLRRAAFDSAGALDRLLYG